MKGVGRKQFRQCTLDPVEPVVARPIPDVPEHFNYGVFFDDDFNYMQFLKPSSDSQTAYRIAEIPENDVLVTDNTGSEMFQPREPECDDEPPPEGLGLESDAEDASELEELEDNFVELAGGPTVTAAEEECTGVCSEDRGASLLKNVAQDKVLLMERFLYGDNERDLDEFFHSSSDGDDDGDQDEDKIFEKLVSSVKNRSKSAGQSVISGSSMMSEGLQFALSRDTRVLHHQCLRSDDLEEFDEDLKLKTLEQGVNMLEQSPTEAESEQSEEIDDLPDVPSIKECPPTTMPRFHQLTVPVKANKRPFEKAGPEDDVSSVTSSRSHDTRLEIAPRRQKGESLEEKRLRKLAVKQHRRERRAVRKVNRRNFHQSEHERQLSTGVRVITIS